MASTDLVKAMAAFTAAIPQDLPEEERVQMLAACKEITDAIETPLETTGRLMLAGYDGIVPRLAVDLKLIDAIVAAAGPVTCEQLAAECGADVALVRRIMRMLVTMKFFSKVDDDKHIPYPRARAFVSGSPLREAVMHLASKFPTIACLPEYFAANGYRNPDDAYNGPFQYAYRTNEHYMSVAQIQRGEQWFQTYPVSEKLRIQNASDVLLVDVGGGLGHDITNFHKAFPNIINENVLPDRDVSLHQCKLDLNMMGSYSSLDRTEAQFKTLLESVEFQLVGTWRPEDSVPGAGMLLEAVLKM